MKQSTPPTRPPIFFVKALVLLSVSLLLIGLILFAVPLPGIEKIGGVFFGRPFSDFSCKDQKNGVLSCSSSTTNEVLVSENLAQLEEALGLKRPYPKVLVGSPMSLWYAEAEVYKTDTIPRYEILDLNEARFYAAGKVMAPDYGVEDLLGNTSVTPPFAIMLIMGSAISLAIAAITYSWSALRK